MDTQSTLDLWAINNLTIMDTQPTLELWAITQPYSYGKSINSRVMDKHWVQYCLLNEVTKIGHDDPSLSIHNTCQHR